LLEWFFRASLKLGDYQGKAGAYSQNGVTKLTNLKLNKMPQTAMFFDNKISGEYPYFNWFYIIILSMRELF
jgi:hypothetical protein